MPADNEIPPSPRQVEASELGANCFKLIDEVGHGFEEIVITKNGKPVAKLIPYREPQKTPVSTQKESMFGKDRGKIMILGDIVSPMPAEWYSDTDDSGEVRS